MRILKQSTAADVLVFMVDSSDHVSGKTGLTLTITMSKGAGAFSSISPTVTERSNGWYTVSLTSSHTDTLGDGALHVTATGADPTDTAFSVVVRHFADLAFPNTSGRGLDVDATGGVEITSGQAALANLDAAVSTRATVSDIFAQVIEGTETLLTTFRFLLDAVAANTTGFPSSPVISKLAGGTRLAATLDANGNRTVSTRDGT